MKSIKDLCNISESNGKTIDIYVQVSGSMNYSDTYDLLEHFINDHSNFKLNIWAVSSNGISKVKSLNDIKFTGPHPNFDEMHKHMLDHVRGICVYFGN